MDFGLELAQVLGLHVVLGPLVSWPLLGFVSGLVVGRLHGRRSLRAAPAPEQHWSEVARWAFACRTSAVFSGTVVLIVVSILAWLATDALGWIGASITSMTTISTLVGARVAFVRRFPRLVPEKTWREHRDDLLLLPGMLYAWAVWPTLAWPFLTSSFDRQTVLVLVMTLAWHFAWGPASDWLRRRLGVIRDAPSELAEKVIAHGARLGVRVRGVSVWRARWANAFALPLTHHVAVTERLLEILEPDELDAVFAHELTHLTESKTIVAMRMLLALIPYSFLWIRPLQGLYGFWAAVGVVVGVLVVARLIRRVTRRAEQHADSGAHDATEDSVYGRALEKLHKDRLLPAVLSPKQQGTHPDLYDRLLAVGVTPDFPRPAPPPPPVSLSRWQALVLWMAMVFVFSLGFALYSHGRRRADVRSLETTAWMQTPAPSELLLLDVYDDETDPRASRLVATALRHLEDPWDVAVRAVALTYTGRCEEARSLLEPLMANANTREDARRLWERTLSEVCEAPTEAWE